MDRRPWLERYDANVPHTLAPYPSATLLDYLSQWAEQRPRHTALHFLGARLTYGELEAQSTALAAALVALGVKPGERVALVLPSAPQFTIAQLATWKARGIILPLNPLYSDHEFAHALSRSGAETVITLSRAYPMIKRIQAQTAVRRVVTTNIKDYLPRAARLLYTVAREKKEGDRVALQAGDVSLMDLIRGYASAPPPAKRPLADDTAVLLLSGGTTGTPKAVMGAHRAFVCAGLQLRSWLQSALREQDATVMLPLPLFHVFANVGGQSLALVGGNALVLVPDPRDFGALVKTIQQTNPSVVVLVPPLIGGLLSHRDVRSGRVDLRSVRACVSGAAPLLTDLKRKFEEVTGGRVIEGYSLTEAMMACLANPLEGANKAGSIGLPLPDVDVRIVDESGDVDLEAGAVGEIILRAPQLMQGYWENAADTAHILRSHGSGPPWLFTGDIGYMDEDGYVFIVDRKKDLIKVSGMQVWPRQVEEVLAKLEEIKDAAVAGVPHARKGEAVHAWIVKQPNAALTEADVRAHCRVWLAPYKVPTYVSFVENLPCNAAGKVLRRELVAQWQASAGAQRSAD